MTRRSQRRRRPCTRGRDAQPVADSVPDARPPAPASRVARRCAPSTRPDPSSRPLIVRNASAMAVPVNRTRHLYMAETRHFHLGPTRLTLRRGTMSPRPPCRPIPSTSTCSPHPRSTSRAHSGAARPARRLGAHGAAGSVNRSARWLASRRLEVRADASEGLQQTQGQARLLDGARCETAGEGAAHRAPLLGQQQPSDDEQDPARRR